MPCEINDEKDVDSITNASATLALKYYWTALKYNERYRRNFV
jgi:hypothetical protein